LTWGSTDLRNWSSPASSAELSPPCGDPVPEVEGFAKESAPFPGTLAKILPVVLLGMALVEVKPLSRLLKVFICGGKAPCVAAKLRRGLLALAGVEALGVGVPKLNPAIGELNVLNIIKSSFFKVT
jgi:hypothetical protein